MKLKTQEKIRGIELSLFLSSLGLMGYLHQFPDANLSHEIIEILNSNDLTIHNIKRLTECIYLLDFYSSFRTQKMTEEYKILDSGYRQFISNIAELYKKLNLSDPIEIFAVYVYMYRKGYFSYNKDFKYSTDMKDFSCLTGLDVVRGRGVCRSIASMLKDIYREMGYESYDVFVKANRESINNLKKLSNVSLKKDVKSKRFVKMVDVVTKVVPMSNHLITMVKHGDKNYILDPTNDGILYKGNKNNLYSSLSSDSYMKYYNYTYLLVNLFGIYNNDLNMVRQNKQLNMPTIDNITYEKKYLEGLKICLENETLFEEFYLNNLDLINGIYNVSEKQNSMFKRIIPIIPKKRKK